MDSKHRIKIELTNENGKHDFVYTPQQLNDLISFLIDHGLKHQVTTPLQGTAVLTEHPIHADRLTFEPAPNSETDMILLIGAGAFELQFRVAAGDVMEILERLKNETEPDPNSARHH